MCACIGKKGAALLLTQLESLSPLLSLAMHDFSFAASMELLNKRGEKISY